MKFAIERLKLKPSWNFSKLGLICEDWKIGTVEITISNLGLSCSATNLTFYTYNNSSNDMIELSHQDITPKVNRVKNRGTIFSLHLENNPSAFSRAKNNRGTLLCFPTVN